MDIAIVVAPPGVTASAARKTSAARQIPFLNRLAIAVVLALSAVLAFASAASAQIMPWAPFSQDPSGNSDGMMPSLIPGFPGLNPLGSQWPQFGPSGPNLGGQGSGDMRSDVGEDAEEVEQTDNNNNGDGNNNGGGESGSGSVRDAPGLVLSARPRNDRTLPLNFRLSGRLKPPEALGAAALMSRELGVDVPAEACNGAVTIAFKASGRLVARRRASVTSTCRFGSGITIDSRRRLGRARTLKATARFGGNQLLAPVRRSTTMQIG